MESLLLELAGVADAISLPAWERGNIDVTLKPDGSPVTATDVAIEEELRAQVGLVFPNDGFCGEEVGDTAAKGDGTTRTWIVDGIDGTRAFTTQSPSWSTHIALATNGVPVAGIVTCPALQRRWYSPGPGAAYTTFDGGPSIALAVSSERSITSALIARWPLVSDVAPSFATYDKRIAPLTAAGQAAMRAAAQSVSTGAMLVASGSLDAFVMFGGQPWDHAAPAAVVQAAGGRFSCLAGTDSLARGAGVYSNGLVHEALIATLQG